MVQGSGCCLSADTPVTLMDDVPLNVLSKQCYLGLIFDDQLNWSCHIGKVCRSMSYYLYLINKHRHVIKEDLLKTLTESLVLSRLSFTLYTVSLEPFTFPVSPSEAAANAKPCCTSL